MNGKIEYNTDETEKIILEHHMKFMPAPTGMIWIVSLKPYGVGAECVLVEKPEKATETENGEVLERKENK